MFVFVILLHFSSYACRFNLVSICNNRDQRTLIIQQRPLRDAVGNKLNMITKPVHLTLTGKRVCWRTSRTQRGGRIHEMQLIPVSFLGWRPGQMAWKCMAFVKCYNYFVSILFVVNSNCSSPCFIEFNKHQYNDKLYELGKQYFCVCLKNYCCCFFLLL